MFIKKIFQDRADEDRSVHRQFVRFSKGHFKKRAVINIKRNSMIKVMTSFELANDLVNFISSLASLFRVQGILLGKDEIPGLEGKKKAGLFVYNVAKELSSEELGNLVSKSYYALLDCSTDGIDLKIKKKLSRPSKKAEAKVDEKFCQLSLDIKYWPQVHSEFLFDLPEVKKAHIKHDYIIEQIIIPKELQAEKEKDFEKIRKEAKRKGKIIREILADGRKIVKEKEFVV